MKLVKKYREKKMKDGKNTSVPMEIDSPASTSKASTSKDTKHFRESIEKKLKEGAHRARKEAYISCCLYLS